ncbi:hypothetical protein K458DRAFT_395661 [Lentithecium fluviatile CBS 122367]|uniref:Uncharacterized protein n=1 Tax=Lentithecium fluviatile CBS 122367 TaxID=1168545 RepID=A0A6G1IHQ1_9PLEO|nr:hypothetical protein K458DRAFT_395661 [Lentithecium fluviatile CBS 122367]
MELCRTERRHIVTISQTNSATWQLPSIPSLNLPIIEVVFVAVLILIAVLVAIIVLAVVVLLVLFAVLVLVAALVPLKPTKSSSLNIQNHHSHTASDTTILTHSRVINPVFPTNTVLTSPPLRPRTAASHRRLSPKMTSPLDKYFHWTLPELQPACRRRSIDPNNLKRSGLKWRLAQNDVD